MARAHPRARVSYEEVVDRPRDVPPAAPFLLRLHQAYAGPLSTKVKEEERLSENKKDVYDLEDIGAVRIRFSWWCIIRVYCLIPVKASQYFRDTLSKPK